MIGRRDLASWLEGPKVASDTPSRYPGERLGRPQAGPGSLARPTRRLLGIMIDWILALLIARAFLRSAGVGSLLLVLAVPALVWDRDQRGLHDKVAGTLVART